VRPTTHFESRPPRRSGSRTLARAHQHDPVTGCRLRTKRIRFQLLPRAHSDTPRIRATARRKRSRASPSDTYPACTTPTDAARGGLPSLAARPLIRPDRTGGHAGSGEGTAHSPSADAESLPDARQRPTELVELGCLSQILAVQDPVGAENSSRHADLRLRPNRGHRVIALRNCAIHPNRPSPSSPRRRPKRLTMRLRDQAVFRGIRGSSAGAPRVRPRVSSATVRRPREEFDRFARNACSRCPDEFSARRG
jgi:hypothetical protein